MAEISEFKLVGVSCADGTGEFLRATCEISPGDSFRVMVDLPLKDKKAIWRLVDGDWENPKVAVIEHEGLFESGTPRNPRVIAVKYSS